MEIKTDITMTMELTVENMNDIIADWVQRNSEYELTEDEKSKIQYKIAQKSDAMDRYSTNVFNGAVVKINTNKGDLK